MRRTPNTGSASIAWLAALALVLPLAALANANKSITIGDDIETGSETTVNGSISVGDRAVINGRLETVNGKIRIGNDTRLGDAETVNGSIEVGNGVSAEDFHSVNGSIRLGMNVIVDGEIEVVNGKITLDRGTSVADSVENVNGEIRLVGASVGGDVKTTQGDISILEGSMVQGDVVVRKPGGWGWSERRRKPTVVIGPGSTVAGQIVLDQEVDLYISNTAQVGGVTGEMSMDDAVRFGGATP